MSESESQTDTALTATNQPMPVHLVATNPVEMAASQADLKSWLVRKIRALDADIVDFNRAINQARDNKWNTTSLARLRDQAVDCQEFYAKLHAAVEAGFTIIPDFPVDIFAIRVNEDRAPRSAIETSRYSKPSLPAEQPNVLPQHEGKYVSPTPSATHWHEQRTEKDGTTNYRLNLAQARDFKDVVFPLRAARMEVMDATAQAMALKLFDRIGICPRERKADPLIIGQICIPARSGKKVASFLIAWHLNLNEL